MNAELQPRRTPTRLEALKRALDTARRHLEATVGADHAEARETRAALAALDGR